MQVTVVDHPLARALLTVLRDETTDRATFRRSLDALAGMVLYEATRRLAVDKVTVRTPLGDAAGVRLTSAPVLVPVLRAGLGFADAAMRLLPDAEMCFVGLARDEHTFKPAAYMAKLPADLEGRECFVLDPMLTTAGSLEYTCRLLADHNAGHLTAVGVLAAPEGLERLGSSGLDIDVVTAAIDERLNERAFIVPGLGDAGDRLFGLS